jgi:DNA-3-methyladenine glycosylase II
MQPIINHFETVDPIMAEVVAAAFAGEAPITLDEPILPDRYFRELASSVVSQQLSTKAAATIWRRFEELAGEVTPERVLALDIDDMRTAGVSRQKAGYLQAMAGSAVNGEVDLQHLASMDDEQVIAELTKLKGIGPWTAEMFLIFGLARPDVFSYLDLGLLRAFEIVYEKPGITRAEMELIVMRWAPYRTYAALALWHHRDKG